MVILASAMILFSGVMLFRTLHSYKLADNEYKTLEDRFVSSVDTTAEDQAAEYVPEGADESEEDDTYRFRRNYKRSDFPSIDIDIKGLKEVNPETVGWLYVGAAGISYPITQRPSDEQNEYYLHHTLEGEENSSGCIFMDWSVNPQLTDWNTFIYGHNMKNGSMFGSLRKFVNNPRIYDKDPYIYIYREEGIYRYKIYSFYLDTPESKMYWTCKTWREYRAYIRSALEMAVYDCKTETSPEENTVTLVTCSGSGAGKKRFFVHGISQDCYLYPPKR